MIKQALLDPTRRKALVNLATLLGGGAGGLGGGYLGLYGGAEVARNNITADDVRAAIESGEGANIVKPYVYGGGGIGALGGAALGGFTARQLAKALLGGDPEKNQQTV